VWLLVSLQLRIVSRQLNGIIRSCWVLRLNAVSLGLVAAAGGIKAKCIQTTAPN